MLSIGLLRHFVPRNDMIVQVIFETQHYPPLTPIYSFTASSQGRILLPVAASYLRRLRTENGGRAAGRSSSAAAIGRTSVSRPAARRTKTAYSNQLQLPR